MTPNQRADAIVKTFCEKTPLPENDAITLRSMIAQQVDQAVTEAREKIGGDRSV